MTLQEAQQKVIESLNGRSSGYLVIGTVFIKAQRYDSLTGKNQFWRFSYQRNKREYWMQPTRLTKAEAAKMLSDVDKETNDQGSWEIKPQISL